jgi:Ca2+-binding RTX toxin-like protein
MPLPLIFGQTDSDDTIDGTIFRDIIFGGSADRPFTHTGDDTIVGKAGDDHMFGGDGDDDLDGSNGSDHLAGGRGNDLMGGHNGDDWVVGGRGRDYVSGDTGDDLTSGGRGIDDCSGGDGHDIVFGGLGRDTTSGGGGDDLLFIVFGENTLEFLSDNNGADTVVGYKPSIDHFDLTAISGLGDFSDLSLTSSGDDVLVDYGTGSFLLKNTDLSSVDSGDFLV